MTRSPASKTAVHDLRRRIGRLERVARAARATGRSDPTEARERFAARMVALAERVRGTPAPPTDRQSVAERIVRAAFSDAEGAAGHEYLRGFWRAVTRRIRAEGRHELWRGAD